MTTQTIAHTVTLKTVECYSCGITFGLLDHYMAARLNDGKSFYCPNGHAGAWSETEADRQKKRADRLEASLIAERDQRAAAERSNSALKGQITRARKRAAAGVCPCCHRTFVQLARHMSNKHPDHAGEPVAEH